MSALYRVKAFKYRAYPNKEQELLMLTLLETHRRLYNTALAERRDAYESEKCLITYADQSKNLTIRRKTDPYLSNANYHSCQRTLRRLEKACDAFFRRVKSGDVKAGFPRFRGYGRFDSVDYTANNGSRIVEKGHVYFQGVGDLKFKEHRHVGGKIKTCSFRHQSGRWYVIFSCDVEIGEVEASLNPPIGIDLGLKSFFVTSDGESVSTPKLYRNAQKKLRRLSRSVARKKKGGKNRKKSIRNIARFHEHIANQRKDFHHKTARDLVNRFGVIAHEKLNIKGIAKSRLSKSTHDAGWAQFLGILTQKAECAAVSVVAVDPRHTTQTCSSCERLPSVSIGLKVRTYICEHCGFSLDRDWNAAINILKRAGIPPIVVKLGDSLVRQ